MPATTLDGRLEGALAFTAPYVIDRLLADRVAETPAAAEQLFTEAKRYLVLCAATPEVSFGMHSSMVDAAWHTFILFTAEYTDFGHRYFGEYLHHSPAADDRTEGPLLKAASFNEFQQRYEELFGQPLPSVWYDDASVVPSRRVINGGTGILTVSVEDATVRLIDDTGASVLSVNALAADALAFIARTRDFFVRELPGGLSDDEKVGVIRALVRSGVLRVAL
ncbi:glycine-rich domain-containing protein [Mycolicibacterium vinylchloridicum]|jgi:hypothetical protein|uniref:glycine-rich domain-containing protein n=1 Tax=Mycolicibacterium vinylchloridicum TaxID=2736928 RepID=UPI0015C8C7C9|nr:hypothetical protein [Mycolicibacterium vinylchloridicum]